MVRWSGRQEATWFVPYCDHNLFSPLPGATAPALHGGGKSLMACAFWCPPFWASFFGGGDGGASPIAHRALDSSQ